MKISFIGAGGVGCSTAFSCGLKGLCDEIILIDLYKDYAMGKAMDLEQSFILNEIKDIKVYGTDDYSYIENSDIIIITAGIPSGNGNITREELLGKNKVVIEEVAKKVKKYSYSNGKEPFIIIVTNPLDVILKHFIEVGDFNKKKTIGSGNWLDTSRFKFYLSKEFNVLPSKIDTFAVGQHGQKIVYLLSQTKIDGISLFDYMKKNNISKEKIKEIEEKATNGAPTIINMIVKGGTFYGPAISISSLVESYIKDENKLVSASIWCNGEYGFKDICIGCPVILGKNGVKEVKSFDISDQEKQNLKDAYDFINMLNNK